MILFYIIFSLLFTVFFLSTFFLHIFVIVVLWRIVDWVLCWFHVLICLLKDLLSFLVLFVCSWTVYYCLIIRYCLIWWIWALVFCLHVGSRFDALSNLPIYYLHQIKFYLLTSLMTVNCQIWNKLKFQPD